MQFLSQKKAIKVMIGLLITVLLFHFLVLFQVIPYAIVWAGKIHTIRELVQFETVSITVNLLMLWVFLLRGQFIKNRLSGKILNGIIGLFAIVFALNTIGNLFAETVFEKVVFTPLTFISVLLCIWIIRGETNKEPKTGFEL